MNKTGMLHNHATLADLSHMDIGEIANLPADQLALLAAECGEAKDELKTLDDRLHGALTLKYGERATDLRRQAGKDTGTVRFDDGPVTIVADLPKKVDWDASRLAALVERIRAAGDDPTEYVDVSYKVPERKYAAWPANIRTVFEAARTVRTGKQTVTLKLKETP